jgi:hypothetical protein
MTSSIFQEVMPLKKTKMAASIEETKMAASIEETKMTGIMYSVGKVNTYRTIV